MASQLGVPDLRIVRSDRVTQLTNPQQNHRDSQSCAIEINNATLRYPLGPHVSGSLKSSLMSFLVIARLNALCNTSTRCAT